MNSFNTSLNFTQEVFILCKKSWGQWGPGAVNFLISFRHAILSNIWTFIEKSMKRVKKMNNLSSYCT